MQTLKLKALLSRRDELARVLPVLEEMERRRTHPYYQYAPDAHPDRDQLGFHRASEPVRLLFGGSQSGKSRAVAHEISWWLTERHPWQATPKAPRIYVVSASYRTIQEGVWRHLKVTIPEWQIAHVGPPVSGFQLPTYIQMKNGAQVDFISGHGEEEAREKCEAAEIDLAVVDEEVGYGVWQALQARRLARGGRAIISATLYKSEPWILEIEDRAVWDETVGIWRLSTKVAAERGHVSANQVEEIEATSTREDSEVRIQGKSRRMHGLVYPEFGPLHVVDPFPIPQAWTRYMAIDPGWKVCAALWAAVDPTGYAYIYRELYKHQRMAKEVVETIFAEEGWMPRPGAEGVTLWTWEEGRTEDVYIRWIDPSAYGHHETGEPRMGTLFAAEYGLVTTRAINDVESGIENVRRLMMSGMDNVPRLRIFSTCANLRRELKAYRRAQSKKLTMSAHDRRDGPMRGDDHACDCLRYLASGGLDYVKRDPDADAQARIDREIEAIKASDEPMTLSKRHALAWRQKSRDSGHGTQHPGGIGDDW